MCSTVLPETDLPQQLLLILQAPVWASSSPRSLTTMPMTLCLALSQYNSSMELLFGCYNSISTTRLFAPGGTLVPITVPEAQWQSLKEEMEPGNECISQETSESRRVCAIFIRVILVRAWLLPVPPSPALLTMSLLFIPHESNYSPDQNATLSHAQRPVLDILHTHLQFCLESRAPEKLVWETALLPTDKQFQWRNCT